MMVLSRLWYVVLALLLGIATYVVFLAVGEYDRRNAVAMEEELASDSQTVGWALTIDARKRLDALLVGAVDKGIQDSLQLATGKDTIPPKAGEEGRRALGAIREKIPAEFRPDALFAVDHDGRVVAQVGYDDANKYPDFELGGYPAVFDALHGYLRDDTWVLGGRPARVVARPVEVDSTQPPLGAIVGLKWVDAPFAQGISKKTRTNVAFFAGGKRIASAVSPGFEESKLTAIDTDLAGLATDKVYAEGRSDLRQPADDVGAIYARFVGEAWDLGAGFVVVRARTSIGGPMGFLSAADDKDKQSVNMALIGGIVALALLVGIGLSVLEQTLPMRQMEKQAAALRKGELDYLQVAKFRGGYRGIAENINAGIERVVEKGGGAVRKPADLESILGPVPAQPAMSAFSFPLAEGAAPPAPPSGPQVVAPFPSSGGGLAPPSGSTQGGPPPRPRPPSPGGPPSQPRPGQGPSFAPQPPGASPRASGPAFPSAGAPIPPPPAATMQRPPPAAQFALDDDPDSVDGDGPTLASALSPTGVPIPPNLPPPQESTLASAGVMRPGVGGPPKPPPDPAAIKLGMGGAPAAGRPPGVPTHTMMGMGLQAQSAVEESAEREDESTVIARAPSDVLAAASGPHKPVVDETAEWMSVYDEFLRTKKQCDEPTDGLSFDKFQNTLRKNRDALVQRHQCKRVRFSVYIKDGRASLKATPVKE